MEKASRPAYSVPFFTQAVLVAGGHMAKACLQGVTGDDVRCSGVAGLQQLVLGSGV